MSKPTEPRIRWMLIHDRAVNEADNPRMLVEVTEIYAAIRYMLAIDRWPEDMSRPDLRDNFKAAWGELGEAAVATDWTDWPVFEPLPGNDYPNVVHFIKERCGIGLPGYPDKPMKWDPGSLELVSA